MDKGLERDLGLYAVLTVSIGAMIGSGIFVLPGIASTIAGPAVVLAYLLAGLMVLPAALSKAEMASAIPESGGTYLYIERAMGPMLGTIAGIGTWFSLVFKSAFALVGLGAYLVFFTTLPAKGVGLGIAALLICVNVLGVKQSGRLQAIIVSAVVLVLVAFVADGITYIERDYLHPFMPHGIDGLLAATGFVFVSYAGVTKVASIAEEIEKPGRNIPLGILLSIGIMMLIYSLVVLVIVGVTTADDLGKTLTPMAAAAAMFLGDYGELLIAATAVLALTSMANAGILSSSRYPFAMSRDKLAPDVLGRIDPRVRTPVWAIALTGSVLLFLIVFVPVAELAKLASAFQILVFILVNIALVVFRESELAWYQPEFRSPGYPWVQLLGVFGGLVLIAQMGLLPLLGSTGILVGGAAWYQFYGRRRTARREGAAPDTLRRVTDQQSLERTDEALREERAFKILVPVDRERSKSQEALSALLSVASHLARTRKGEVFVVRFEEVPDQVTLAAAAAERTTDDLAFEEAMESLSHRYTVPVEWGEIVSHDTKRALVNYAERGHANVILGEWKPGFRRWLIDHAPCDLMFVTDRGLDSISNVGVVTERGPHEPLEVSTAEAIARETGAAITFLYPLKSSAPEAQAQSVAAYHEELAQLCSVRTDSRILVADDHRRALIEATEDFDLVIMSESSHRFLHDVVFGHLPDEIAEKSRCPVILVHSRKPFRHTFLRWIVDELIY